MSWVKLTDDFTEHPKLLAAGPLAGWLWISGLAWSNRNRTDGRIPSSVVPRLASFEGVGVFDGNFAGHDATPREFAGVLVDVGLWEETEGGYLIHDYDLYQLTVAEQEKRSDAKRRAGQAGGKASAQARASAPASTGASAGGLAESKPVSRIPLKKSLSSSTSATGKQSPGASDDDDDELDDLWNLFADRKLAAMNGSIKNPGPWKRKVTANARVEFAEQARTWLDTYDVTISELADALVAGQPSRTWTRRR